MSHKFLTSERLDALIDGELRTDEAVRAEAEIQNDPLLQKARRVRKKEQELIHHALHTNTDRVYQEAGIDRQMEEMMARLMLQIDEPAPVSLDSFAPAEEAPFAIPATPIPIPAPVHPQHLALPASSVAGTPWWKAVLGWFQAHPSLSVAFAGATVVLVIFAVPMLDPGPNANDCVVDNVVGRKKDTVAVLQSNNQSGQPMTVIIVENPPPSPAEIEAESRDKKPFKARTPAPPKTLKDKKTKAGRSEAPAPSLKAPSPRKD